MAVKILWVLVSVWYVHGTATPMFQQYDNPNKCREAAIQEVESGNATFAFCTEGYATPLQYLPYSR